MLDAVFSLRCRVTVAPGATVRVAFWTMAAGIVAHLGNGASLCAMRDGSSQDTTMSFTALDGLAMGTRCGTLDAGVVLYMLQQSASCATRSLVRTARSENVQAESSYVYRLAATLTLPKHR